MRREDKSGIRDPGKLGIFGGKIEQGESPLEAAIREIKEETNLQIVASDLKHFKSYKQNRDYLTGTSILHVYVIRNINPNKLRTFEGQGFTILKDQNRPNLAEDVREVFDDWFAKH